MTRTDGTRWPRGILAVVATIGALVGVVVPVLWAVLALDNGETVGAAVFVALAVPPLPVVGGLVARVRPANPIGWLMLLTGVANAIGLVVNQAVTYGFRHGWSHPTLGWLGWADDVCWVLGLPTLPLLLLFLPSGTLPGRRWRVWVVAAAAGLTAATFSTATASRTVTELQSRGVAIPRPQLLAIPASVSAALWSFGLATLAIAGLAALVSIPWRWRSATPDERRRIAPILAVALLLGTVVLANQAFQFGGSVFTAIGLGLASGLLPLCVAYGVLQYRLLGVDVLVSRALVYALTSVGLLGTYIAVVHLANAALDGWVRQVPPLLSTGLLALALAPVYRSIHGCVERALWGERADPVRSVAEIQSRLQRAEDPEAALNALAETVAFSVRSPGATVEVILPDETLVGHWGAVRDETVVLPLHYRDAPIGRMTLASRQPGLSFGRRDRRLLEVLAQQVAFAARLIVLNAEVERSRRSLVVTVAEERRRVHRDVHDGLGARLTGLTLGLEHLGNVLEDAGDDGSRQVAERLTGEARAAVNDVRQIVAGLRPPSLDGLGLEAALAAQARAVTAGGLAPEVDVAAEGAAVQLPAAVEVAAFRIGCEALNNAVRHARASRISVRLCFGEPFRLTVRDDGTGIDETAERGVGLESMQQRAAEVGGTVCVQSSDGGTAVLATLPIELRP